MGRVLTDEKLWNAARHHRTRFVWFAALLNVHIDGRAFCVLHKRQECVAARHIAFEGKCVQLLQFRCRRFVFGNLG